MPLIDCCQILFSQSLTIVMSLLFYLKTIFFREADENIAPLRFRLNVYMSYQKVQNFKCRCPLTHAGLFKAVVHRWIFLSLSRCKGTFGIHQSHQVPNIPCDRSLNDVFLNQHLQWYHNFDSVSARKLVRAICENVNVNDALFSLHETIVKRNISVDNYKCRSQRCKTLLSFTASR